MVTIIATVSYREWLRTLDKATRRRVGAAVIVLEDQGLALRFPLCSAIEGGRYPLRELRIQVDARPLRVFHAFDPKRQAVLLIGGDKTGESDARFYRRLVPIAEAVWEEYLADMAAEEKKGTP